MLDEQEQTNIKNLLKEYEEAGLISGVVERWLFKDILDNTNTR